jgi:type I restriction enzyme S subunit
LPKSNRTAGAVPIVSSSGITGSHDQARVEAPAVVTGRYGTLGDVYYLDKPCWPLNTTLYVKDFHGNDPRFCSLLLENQKLGTHDGAAAVPGVNRNVLHELPVRIPALAIQRKIAAVFSAFDSLIENNNRRIKLLGEMAQRVYREWCVDLRYPGHAGVPLVHSELGPIPEGWRVCTLGNICERITDGAHASPPTTKAGPPMGSVKDMRDFGLDLSGCRRISQKDYAALVRQNCQPSPGDVLVSKDGAKYLDKVLVVQEETEIVLLSSIAILRPHEGLPPSFLVLLLKDPETKARLKGRVSGAAIPRVVLKDFETFRVVVPPEGLRDELQRVAGDMLCCAFRLEAANRALSGMRGTLLPRVITGEVDADELGAGLPAIVL